MYIHNASTFSTNFARVFTLAKICYNPYQMLRFNVVTKSGTEPSAFHDHAERRGVFSDRTQKHHRHLDLL
jgi:hypothetical protein